MDELFNSDLAGEIDKFFIEMYLTLEQLALMRLS